MRLGFLSVLLDENDHGEEGRGQDRGPGQDRGHGQGRGQGGHGMLNVSKK